jgi:very-short-patch-repair endonuclease
MLALGFEPRAITYRLKVGRLHLLHRGVYAVGHRPPSPLAAAMAAVLACGPDAVLSHRSAAALWRIIPRWPWPVDVTAPTRRHHAGIRPRRSPHAKTTTRHVIPTTTPAQTLLDLADVLDDRALARAVKEAYVLHLTTPRQLAALLTRSPGRRTSRLKAHTTAAKPTRSPLEDDFLRFVKRHRLPVPEVSPRIAGHLVDFVWREQRLVAELDSWGFHSTKRAFETDRERDADLLTEGFRTIRITYKRLEQNPKKEAKRLRSLLG